MKQTYQWLGKLPTHCQLCGIRLKTVFIDARLKTGQWGNVCRKCHKAYGTGLGTGKGQEYDTQTGKKLRG